MIGCVSKEEFKYGAISPTVSKAEMRMRESSAISRRFKFDVASSAAPSFARAMIALVCTVNEGSFIMRSVIFEVRVRRCSCVQLWEDRLMLLHAHIHWDHRGGGLSLRWQKWHAKLPARKLSRRAQQARGQRGGGSRCGMAESDSHPPKHFSSESARGRF